MANENCWDKTVHAPHAWREGDELHGCDGNTIGTCRIWCCTEDAEPGELCAMHKRPADLELASEYEGRRRFA